MEKVLIVEGQVGVIMPRFYEMIVEHEACVMCTSMIASVCSHVGLGSLLRSFMTNSNKTLNNLLKWKADF